MAAMMAAARLEDLDNTFDDHASVTISASLEDFEDQERPSPLVDLPSQHSGFRSEQDDSELDDHSSAGLPWSPPGFARRTTNASGWFRHDPYARYDLQPSSPARSRQTSPEYQDAQEGDPDVTIAAPAAPDPMPAGTDSPIKERSPEPELPADDMRRPFDQFDPVSPESPNNCISDPVLPGPCLSAD